MELQLNKLKTFLQKFICYVIHYNIVKLDNDLTYKLSKLQNLTLINEHLDFNIEFLIRASKHFDSTDANNCNLLFFYNFFISIESYEICRTLN